MKWKGDMKINQYSFPVTISLKMIDETILGRWDGHGVMDDSADVRQWLQESRGRILETDIGAIVIDSFQVNRAGKMVVHFSCAGEPKGRLVQEIELIKPEP
jgi:hypothetical protein